MNKPLITFIAVAHNESKWDTPFIDSIRAQLSDNWKAVIYHNGHNATLRDRIGFIADHRLIYKESSTDTGVWGCYNRQKAIEECDTDYIIQTSIGDYWLPQAVENIQKMLDQSPDICLWNSINHLVAPCQMLDSQLAWSKIDWGNFAIRTDIAKKIGIKHPTEYCADWFFIKDVMNSGLIKKTLKCSGILTIHN